MGRNSIVQPGTVMPCATADAILYDVRWVAGKNVAQLKGLCRHCWSSCAKHWGRQHFERGFCKPNNQLIVGSWEAPSKSCGVQCFARPLQASGHLIPLWCAAGPIKDGGDNEFACCSDSVPNPTKFFQGKKVTWSWKWFLKGTEKGLGILETAKGLCAPQASRIPAYKESFFL